MMQPSPSQPAPLPQQGVPPVAAPVVPATGPPKRGSREIASVILAICGLVFGIASIGATAAAWNATTYAELKLRDGLTEPVHQSEPAPQSCVFPARTNPIVSQFGHVPELDQPRLGPLSNWQVAPKASLWSYLECLFPVLDACKEPSVIVILVL